MHIAQSSYYHATSKADMALVTRLGAYTLHNITVMPVA